ncbi:MAG: hypothetical protein L7H18_00875 [Candidatus Nealsonbacteria bacterium DGGOD1a]|nr:MAG: hypothetical protein L7H18_00875 [Candidatus Nealsonbacteria bacterium DGGOD1a]
MKVFLFLYPIKPFFENEIGNFYQFRNGKYDVRRLNDIIRARYRKKKYKIVWLLFGQENAPNKPDKDLLASWITIEPEDTIISAGLSFKEHTQHRKYPNPESIFGQISNITEIILGGFHQWDCVNKLASYAHNLGLPVKVDEETTEMFFSLTNLLGPLPLIRDFPLTLKEIFDDGNGLEDATSARVGMPWFMQQ